MSFTDQDELRFQRACEMYQETQRRKQELPEKDKRLFERLDQLDIGRYSVSFHTLVMIAKAYDNNAINSFDTIFKLGFLKGQRAEKARQKKKVCKD